jgi:hypothetical protein
MINRTDGSTPGAPTLTTTDESNETTMKANSSLINK